MEALNDHSLLGHVLVSIANNLSSLRIQRQLGTTSSALGDVFQRLSSGQRINQSSDDAAGLAVALSLQSDTRVYSQAARNVNDAMSYLNIADGATRALKNILVRLRELAAQSSNGVYTNTQR